MSSHIFRWLAISLATIVLCFLSRGFLIRAQTTSQSSASAQDAEYPHEPDQWFTMNKDYSSQRYVDLDQITPQNVGQLKEVCEIQLNEPVMFSSGLLKVGRTLYVATLRGTYAIDAVTCDLRWKHVIDFLQTPATVTQRGLGYLDGRIFRGTGDGRVIALDAKTGEPLWPDIQAADPKNHEAFSSAPIAAAGKVFIGIVTSDAGIAGRLMAFDARSGAQQWSFPTTLGYKSGGGFWTSYSLDPKTGEVFAGIANPWPDFSRHDDQNNDTTKTNSVISIDAMNIPEAQLNWFYQAVPKDEHDWDLATAPTLYHTRSGKDMLAIAGKGGRVYGIDRATHALVFNTPATTMLHDQEPLDDTWKLVCPGVQGGALFNGTAYHPGTGMLYVGMSDHCAYYISSGAFPPELGGFVWKDWSVAAKQQGPRGWITAMDGETGHVIWQYHTEGQVNAGLVPTKSGLLFAGDSHGNLLMLNAENGSLLRSIDVKGALNNGLISYQVKGEQYVAAAVGGPIENPSPVAGPLRVVVFGLHGSDTPKVVTLARLPPQFPPAPPSGALFFQVCTQCHGYDGSGVSAPPIIRQSQLADPELLKTFLETVPAPMPRLYPGLLNDEDVDLIAEHLRTVVFKCGQTGGQSCKPPGEPSTGGTEAWQAIYSVLTSPRCLNCHPGPQSTRTPPIPGWPDRAFDYPRQGDDRHPHYFSVIRGPEIDPTTGQLDNKGAPFGRCDTCHGIANDSTTGIPGAKNPTTGKTAWALAPAEMAWETSPGVPMTGAELCAQLTDKARNGNRSPEQLLEHVTTEPLVLWAWQPGIRPNGEARTIPPVGSHEEFVNIFEEWIDAGSPCPAQSSTTTLARAQR